MTSRKKAIVPGNPILGIRVLLDFLALAAKGIAAGIVTCVMLAALVLLFSGAAGAAGFA